MYNYAYIYYCNYFDYYLNNIIPIGAGIIVGNININNIELTRELFYSLIDELIKLLKEKYSDNPEITSDFINFINFNYLDRILISIDDQKKLGFINFVEIIRFISEYKGNHRFISRSFMRIIKYDEKIQKIFGFIVMIKNFSDKNDEHLIIDIYIFFKTITDL